MATATKICKVCGKEYEYCHTLRRIGVFRWQDVACCAEHGSIYFARVEESRNPDISQAEVEQYNYVYSENIEDEDDDLYDDPFEDIDGEKE